LEILRQNNERLAVIFRELAGWDADYPAAPEGPGKIL
jgi:hypothetical protein